MDKFSFLLLLLPLMIETVVWFLSTKQKFIKSDKWLPTRLSVLFLGFFGWFVSGIV